MIRSSTQRDAYSFYKRNVTLYLFFLEFWSHANYVSSLTLISHPARFVDRQRSWMLSSFIHGITTASFLRETISNVTLSFIDISAAIKCAWFPRRIAMNKTLVRLITDDVLPLQSYGQAFTRVSRHSWLANSCRFYFNVAIFILEIK